MEGGTTALKNGYTCIPFSGCFMGSDVRLVYFALVGLSRFVFVFLFRKNQVIVFLRPDKSIRGEKKTNGCANQVDEEYNRRASIFLPINPLKMNMSWFDYFVTRWG